MGIYRYILAILVLLSHCGVSFFGYNQGVAAVVSFFIISGYVISLLIQNHYNHRKEIFLFYADRVLRIFPQFIFYLFITSIVLIYYGELVIPDDSVRVIINTIMVPLNFFAVYNDSYIIVPQSWSLGLEMQFYILFPLIMAFFNLKKCFILSFVLFLIAYIQIVNPDFYGYRMITGTLFIFIIGGMLTELQKHKKNIALIYITIATLLFVSVTTKQLHDNRIIEVLSGVIIGLPVIITLIKKKIKNNIDLLMGNLSYGVYLNHMMISFLLVKIGFDITNIGTLISLIVISTSLSYLSFKFIEKPIYKLRHLLRRSHEFNDKSKNPRRKSFL